MNQYKLKPQSQPEPNPQTLTKHRYQLYHSLSLKKNQSRFTPSELSLFSLITSSSNSTIVPSFFQSLLSFSPFQIDNHINKLTQFISYSHLPQFQNIKAYEQIIMIGAEWESLKDMMKMYGEVMKGDEEMTWGMFEDYVGVFEGYAFGFREREEKREQFVKDLAAKFNKGAEWVLQTINRTKEVVKDSIVKEWQIVHQKLRTQNQVKHLKYISQQFRNVFQQYLKKDAGRVHEVRKGEIQWLQNLCLMWGGQGEKFPFAKEIEVWNSCSGQVISRGKLKSLYFALLRILISEVQKAPESERQRKQLLHMQTNPSFKSSLFLLSLTIHCHIFLNQLLNIHRIPSLFPQLPTYQLQKTLTLLTTPHLSLPFPLLKTLFFLQKDLLLFTISLQSYISITQSISRNQQKYQPSYLRRINELLALRYLEFQYLIGGHKISRFYHAIVKNFYKVRDGELLKANFDHVILMASYLWGRERGENGWKMAELVGMYERLPRKIENIKEIGQKPMVTLYNEGFVGYVVENGIGKGWERQEELKVRRDFVDLMCDRYETEMRKEMGARKQGKEGLVDLRDYMSIEQKEQQHIIMMEQDLVQEPQEHQNKEQSVMQVQQQYCEQQQSIKKTKPKNKLKMKK